MMFGRTDWALGGIPLATVSVEYLRDPATPAAAPGVVMSLFDMRVFEVGVRGVSYFATPPHLIALISIAVLLARALAAALIEMEECRVKRLRRELLRQRLKDRAERIVAPMPPP